MKTSEALAAAPIGVQEIVLANYGYEITGNRHIECPFCSQKKFRINYAQKLGGQYAGICVCGSYPLIKLAEHRSRKQGKAFLDEIDELIGNKQDAQQLASDRTPEQKAWDRLRSGVPIKGTQAHTYLKARGNNILPRHNCVYIDKMPFYDTEGTLKAHYGAIYTLLTNELGRAVNEHITYLDRGHKAPVENYRKIRTVSKAGGAVAGRIYDGQEIMAVGEGLESCLSFSQVFKVPCLPAMNTANLKQYRAPEYVKRLLIAADHDYNGAGMAAAMECAHRNILQRPNLELVQVIYPDEMGADFNDALADPDMLREVLVCKKPK